MAKKIYNLPLQKVLVFIKNNKDTITKLTSDKNILELHKLLGRGFYVVELDKFITFFKITKDTKYALNTIEHFNSINFIDTLASHLHFAQFELEKNHINKKDFFYAFCNIFHKKEPELFKHFFEKVFLHYHTAFNNSSNINIDFKNIALELAKQKRLQVKESFGEDEDGSYFKILINNTTIIDEKGKLIKTLRKKAYKKFFDFIIDFEDESNSAKDEAYVRLQELKEF